MPEDDLGGLAGWTVDVIERLGPGGVGALVALETVFPPIPSEVILPFAGFASSQGDVNVVAAWVAATVGAIAGAIILYTVGALIGYERVHDLAGQRWFFLFGQADLERGERFFARHGAKIVLLGRCVPLVRSIVSVPAGLERMPLGRFLLLTGIGSGVWNAAFIAAGYGLGTQWDEVERWVQPVSYTVAALLLLAVAWLALRRARLRRARARDPEPV